MASNTTHHILTVTVENKPGVLSRVAGLFSRRAFNIVSLAVSPTDDERFSRMTIVVDAESAPLEQVVKQLNKLIPVIKITEVAPAEGVERELMLVIVKAAAETRSQVTELTAIFEAKIVDVGYEAMTIMVVGEPEKLDAFSDLVKPFGIVELQRTGPHRAAEARPGIDPAALGQDRPGLISVSVPAPIDDTIAVPSMLRPSTRRILSMPATVYYDNDADTGLIADKLVAILGYGSQGHAHALNLKDSGIDVVVGLRAGSKSQAKAEAAGLRVLPTADAVREADIVMVLLPDTEQKKVYEADIAPNLVDGNSLAFAHGFNIHFDQIAPPAGVDVWMIAPKGPGHLVRRTYDEGGGVPCLIAVHNDATGKSKEIGLAYAKGIGGTRAGVLDTTFQEETETDLFGEQVVLCGGLVELIRNGFDTLVEAGYQPESAYFETLHEVKLIVDLIYEGGIAAMNYSISDTAEYGEMSRGPRVVTPQTKKEMKKILGEIQSGDFAREWIAENENGRPNFDRMREAAAKHPIEKVGAELRSMMPWIAAGKQRVQDVSGG